MELKAYTRATLHDWVHSDAFADAAEIPISKIRALSHIANPRASDSDILLLCWYGEHQLMAYLGLLPDHIFDNEGNKQRFAWLSCIWVHPKQRGQRLSHKLLDIAFEKWQGRLVGTEFVPSLEYMYRKSGLFPLFKRYKGVRMYRRLHLSAWLPPRHQFWHKIRPGLKFIDTTFNRLLDVVTVKPTADFKKYLVSFIPEDIEQLIAKCGNKNAFHRGKTELDWIIKFPWISTLPDADQNRYHFSVYDPTFRQDILAVRNEFGKLESFALLTLRNRVLKTSYLFCLPHAKSMLQSLIAAYMHEYRVTVLLSWNIKEPAQKSQGLLDRKFNRSAIRTYMATENLAPLLQEQIQDGDGDCVFT
jgi:hypothetical protein